MPYGASESAPARERCRAGDAVNRCVLGQLLGLSLANDASPAAYERLVGGTMVLAGVCGAAPPGRECGTDRRV